jgi:phosphopantetheinyl transferase
MAHVYWNLVFEPADRGEDFLSSVEKDRLNGMRFARRRQSFLVGRWAAKQLLEWHPSCAGSPPSSITIANRPSGEPYAGIDNFEIPGCLSISHRDDVAVAALVISPGIRVGIDLEKIEQRIPGFVDDFFTPQEVRFCRSLPERDAVTRVACIWSAKESVLKALGIGLREDTRSVDISFCEGTVRADGWTPLQALGTALEDRTCRVWWRPWGFYLLTLAVVEENKSFAETEPIILEQLLQERDEFCIRELNVRS